MLQEIVSVAVQNVQNMESIIKEPNKNGTVSPSHSNGNDPYKHFVSLTSRHNLPLKRYQIHFGHNLHCCSDFHFLYPHRVCQGWSLNK